MSRSAARARTGHDRTSLYSEITDKIIAELEAGRVPWVQPWGTAAAKAPTRHAEERGDAAPLLRRQCPDSLGGRHRARLRRPELANVSPGPEPWRQRAQRRARHHRRLCRPLHSRRGTQAGGARRRRSPGRSRSSSDLPCSTPINARTFPANWSTAPPPVPEGLILPQAEALIAATGTNFRIGGDRAFYSPAHDYVQVPRPHAYFEPINWHRTALHELGHNAVTGVMPHRTEMRRLPA